MITYLIPCRLESTRYPNKPLLDICGLPMFAHVYFRTLMAVGDNDNVFVCTHNYEIMEECERLNIEYIETDRLPVNGTERIAQAADKLGLSGSDIVVNVQGDDPMVNPEDLITLANYHKNRSGVDIMLPHIKMKEPRTDLLSGHIVTDSYDNILLISRNPIPSNFRKKIPYKKTLSIQSFRADALYQFAAEPETELEKIEGIEHLRAIDMGLSMETFELEREYTPVDVPEQYEIVCKKMVDDPLFLEYSHLVTKK